MYILHTHTHTHVPPRCAKRRATQGVLNQKKKRANVGSIENGGTNSRVAEQDMRRPQATAKYTWLFLERECRISQPSGSCVCRQRTQKRNSRRVRRVAYTGGYARG